MRAKPGPPAWPRWDWIGAGVVFVVTITAFLPALGNGFVLWDDERNFLDNPHYRGLGATQIAWMFTTFLSGLYIPVTWLTLGLDYALWGMNPAGYHLSSLVLHALTAVVVYRIARRLIGLTQSASDDELRLAAVAAALFFAVHPLRVESVAWATERRDVVSGLFYALSVLGYLHCCAWGAGDARRRRWYWTSVGLFAVALLAKPIVVTLPAILLLLDVYPLRRPGTVSWPVLLREKLPFAILSLGASVLAVVAMRAGGKLSGAELGVLERVAISLYSIALYLAKTIEPVRLSPMYELPFQLRAFAPPFVIAAVLVVALTAVVVALARRWIVLPIVWLGYLVTLLPVLGLVHNGPQIAADRYTYLATLGGALLGGGAMLWAMRTLAEHWPGGIARHAPAALAALAVIALAALTWSQTKVWRDSETLWRHALAISPSSIAYAKLGVLRDEKGRSSEAIAYFRDALRLHPDLAYAHNNWGIALARQGRWDEAIPHYRDALKIAPESVEAHLNLALALTRTGKIEEAADHLRVARRLREGR